MRQLIFQEYVTLDGYAADADGETSFFGTVGEHDAEDRATFEWIDTMLLGAETYRLFVGVWPTLEHPIAPLLNALRKVPVGQHLAVPFAAGRRLGRRDRAARLPAAA